MNPNPRERQLLCVLANARDAAMRDEPGALDALRRAITDWQAYDRQRPRAVVTTRVVSGEVAR